MEINFFLDSPDQRAVDYFIGGFKKYATNIAKTDKTPIVIKRPWNPIKPPSVLANKAPETPAIP